MATSRPRRGSRARYTSPMPPAPIRESTSYGPRRVPACRAMWLPRIMPVPSGGPIGDSQPSTTEVQPCRAEGTAPAHLGRTPLRPRVAQRPHFRHWPQLCEELAHAAKAHDSVIDGEIVCLDARGRSNFKSLLFRRERPYFYAFDLLAVDGEDLQEWPLVERKRRLRRLIPSVPTRLLYVDHVEARGQGLLRGRVCARPRGHRGQARSRSLPCGRHEHQLVQDQESRVHADDRSPRTLRAPNRFAQAPSDAARPVSAPAGWLPPSVCSRTSAVTLALGSTRRIAPVLLHPVHDFLDRLIARDHV